MKIEIPIDKTKTVWKSVRYDWRFWAATTAALAVLCAVRCLMAACRRAAHRREA